MNSLLRALLALSLARATKIENCMFDPETKTWISLCKPCKCPTAQIDEESSVASQISKVKKNHQNIAQYCSNAANLDGLLHVTKRSLEEKLQEHFQGEPEGSEINFQLKVRLKSGANAEDVLQLLVNSLIPHNPASDKRDNFAVKLLKNVIPGEFDFKPEVHFIPVLVAVSAIALYYRIIPVKFFLFLFLTTSYILTYVEQMEAYYRCIAIKRLQEAPVGEGGGEGREFSYFNPVSWFSGKTPINGGSECDSAVRPLTVAIIMMTEHFLEPLPIFAKTLNQFVTAAFSDLSYLQWPVMMMVMFLLIYAIVTFVLFMSGLTLKFRLLGGLLADCEVGRKESAAINLPQLIQPSPDQEKLALLCQKLDNMDLALKQVVPQHISSGPEVVNFPRIQYAGNGDGSGDSFGRSIIVDAPVVRRRRVEKDCDLPAVVKGVGRNTCAFASLANLIPGLDEGDIHGMMNFRELPVGMSMGEVEEFMVSDKYEMRSYVECVEVLRPESIEEMKCALLELQSCNTKMVANFHIQSIYTTYKPHEDYGHFSPIVRVTPDQVCIGDVWEKVPTYKWVSHDKFFKSISTIDANTNNYRGILTFALAQNKKDA